MIFTGQEEESREMLNIDENQENNFYCMTVHKAKGLEFDQVIVPHCTEKNYQTAPDRQMLYVACTRAMHKLYLTYTGKPSKFLKI